MTAAIQKATPVAFGNPSGVSFTPNPSPKDQIKASVVEKNAAAIYEKVKGVLDKELETGRALLKANNNTLPENEGWKVFMLKREEEKSSTVVVSFFPLRTEKLIKENTVEIGSMSESKERCFNSILTACLFKMCNATGFGYASAIGWVENIKGTEMSGLIQSKILRSCVKLQVDGIPAQLQNLF